MTFGETFLRVHLGLDLDRLILNRRLCCRRGDCADPFLFRILIRGESIVELILQVVVLNLQVVDTRGQGELFLAEQLCVLAERFVFTLEFFCKLRPVVIIIQQANSQSGKEPRDYADDY